jgi:hypothetical protein
MSAPLLAAWRAVHDLPSTLRRLSAACENAAASFFLRDGSSRSMRALALQGYSIVSVAHPPRVALAGRHELREAWPNVAAALPVGSTLFVVALDTVEGKVWAVRPVNIDGELGAVRAVS